MTRRLRHLIPLAILAAAVIAPALITSSCGCGHRASGSLPDTIRVATLYGPASFFYYRDTVMGYDHDLMEELAIDHSRKVQWVIVNSLEEAVGLVDSGKVQIVAAPVPTNTDDRRKVLFCGPTTYIEQVLVQPPGDTVVVDVNQLVGRTVYVEKDSKGARDLERLNDHLGGGINIRPVDADSLATEDMLASVARGDIPLAVVDRTTARLNKSYFPELNITLALSDPETARWAVARKDVWLANLINEWIEGYRMTDQEKDTVNEPEILKKYLDSSKNFPVEGAKYDRNFKNGYASPFDHLFRQHTRESTWDWRMLAAQAYQESRFDSTARSWAGAKGVMQIMPGTARAFGLKPAEMSNASRSIETAVAILDRFDSMLEPKVTDPIERRKFVLASYNAGPGHVFDAIRLAQKYGYDPQVWDDNVERAMLMKMNRKYYRDPVVKYGYSRGRETVDYVKKIYSYYDEVREKIPH